MRHLLFVAVFLVESPVVAQTIIGLTPGRNASTVSPLSSVTATLSVAPASTAKLSVFSSQMGGRKAGTTTVTGSALQFIPAVAYRPGELLTAVYTGGAGGPAQAWQFTAAATGGSGQFTLSNQVPTQFDYFSNEGLVRLADVDADGDLDLLTMGDTDQNVTRSQLSVQLNNGQGTFTAGWSTAVPMSRAWQWKCQLEAADLDNDGDLDILCGGSAGTYVYANNGDGTFQLRFSIPIYTCYNLVVGDLDADGDLDFVQTNVGSSSHLFLTSYALGLNNGAGYFTISYPFSGRPGDPGNGVLKAFRDLDGNGTLDELEENLVSTNNTTVRVLAASLNSGPATFGALQPITTTADSLASWVTTDLDNDHDLDVLILVDGCTRCNPKLEALYNNGTGQFGTRVTLPTPGLTRGNRHLAIADLTGDGRPDLLVTGLSNSVLVLPGLRNGTFGPATSFTATTTAGTPSAAPDPVLGDLDGDGDIDAAVPFYPYGNLPHFTSILLNTNTALSTAANQSPGLAQMWPNPASAGSEVLHLALLATTPADEVRLITAVGQVVRRQPLAGLSAELPLRGLAPGLYLLTLHRAGILIARQRVVVE